MNIASLTKQEMAKLIFKLRAAIPSSDKIETSVWNTRAVEYFEALKSYTFPEVEQAVEDVIREEKFFPTIPNLVERCRNIRAHANNRVTIDGMNFTREEIAQIKKENKYRQLAEKTMEKMTQEELAPYRQRAIDEIGFKGGRINSVGEMGIFWHIRESIRKELMGEGQFTLKKGAYF